MLKLYKLKGEIVAYEFVNYDSVEFVDTEFNPNLKLVKGKLIDEPNQVVLAKEKFDEGKIMVNITSDGAAIHTEFIDSIEYDVDRGDKFFDTLKEAQEYVDSLSKK